MTHIYDVIIVGSGAGGSAAAYQLCKAGKKVLMLESGPTYSPEKDYRLHMPSWERQGFPEKVNSSLDHSFASLQPLDKTYETLRSWNRVSGRLNSHSQRYGWKYHHVRGVGGSTLHFTGEAHRFNPVNMHLQTDYQVGADWPVSYRDLERFYDQAEMVVGVSGEQTQPDLRCPRKNNFPLPPHSQSLASRTLGKGFKRLGMHWRPNSLAVLPQPYDNRPGCNYCGQCTRGCPRKDKGSADVTFIAKAMATGNLVLKTEHQVTGIQANPETKRVESIQVRNESGHPLVFKTSILILACGVMETPRLLLLSKSKHSHQGLANESAQVGKNLMESLSWVSTGLVDKNIYSYMGLPSDHICWDYNAANSIPGVIGGCRFTLGTLESGISGPINHARRVVTGWGRAHRQQMRDTIGKTLSISALGEFLPNTKSFVALNHQKLDRYSQPVVKIHSQLMPEDIRRLSFMAKKSRQILKASGVGVLVEEYSSYDFYNVSQAFGTCRMGHNPSTSVVNAYGRSHRWKNLYIADGSVFPSSGGGEAPSLTIEALALRTAEHIVESVLLKT